MTSPENRNKDWAAGLASYLSIWGLPKIAIIGSFFAPETARTIIWIAALALMGTACIVNARRCGRVHCRYTGPFYLTLIVPVLVFGTGTAEASPYLWAILGSAAVLGGYAITWITERLWDRYG